MLKRKDPINWIKSYCRDPEHPERPFNLYPEQETFLREFLTLTDDGALPFPDGVFSTGKKNGKSTTAALATLFVIVGLGERFGEGLIIANTEMQASDRIFQACCRIVEASPQLKAGARIRQNCIEFTATGSTIRAISSNEKAAAGSSPNFVAADETAYFTTERSLRLWDENLPSPTRRVRARLQTSYSGFSSESKLLESFYERGLKGEQIAPGLYKQPGLLMAWHQNPAPWITPEWIEQQRVSMRPEAFRRIILNQWVSASESFLTVEQVDAVIDERALPVLGNKSLKVWIGLDASVKHDATAMVAVTMMPDGRLRLIAHRIFQPSPENPTDFAAVERAVLEWAAIYNVQGLLADPTQMFYCLQRLARAGVPVSEFLQTSANLQTASASLYEVIRDRLIVLYANSDIRNALLQSSAITNPTTGSFRIAKSKAKFKIDAAVALSWAVWACLAANGKSQRWEVVPAPWAYPDDTSEPGVAQPATNMSKKAEVFREKYKRDEIPISEAEKMGGRRVYRGNWGTEFSPEERAEYLTSGDDGSDNPYGHEDVGFVLSDPADQARLAAWRGQARRSGNAVSPVNGSIMVRG